MILCNNKMINFEGLGLFYIGTLHVHKVGNSSFVTIPCRFKNRVQSTMSNKGKNIDEINISCLVINDSSINISNLDEIENKKNIAVVFTGILRNYLTIPHRLLSSQNIKLNKRVFVLFSTVNEGILLNMLYGKEDDKTKRRFV